MNAMGPPLQPALARRGNLKHHRLDALGKRVPLVREHGESSKGLLAQGKRLRAAWVRAGKQLDFTFTPDIPHTTIGTPPSLQVTQ